MSSGYVLGFSNNTFSEFVGDSVKRDIYSKLYDRGSGSKAHRLRKFWEIEPNFVVAKLLGDLLDIAKIEQPSLKDDSLFEECKHIVERLRQGAPVEALTELSEELEERDFERLVKAIRNSIDNNEPEEGLDRLHTFVTKYLRTICVKRGIETEKDKPLHSLMGEYIKAVRAEGAIDTVMTERILKSSISNLEAFNTVRNNHSLAHDNPILNYNESLLIFTNVVSSIRFIQSLERPHKPEEELASAEDEDDLPF